MRAGPVALVRRFLKRGQLSQSLRRPDTPVELVIEHLEYILKHLGEDGVGFGSDFDGAEIPAGIGNASGLQNLVKVMRTRGYGNALMKSFATKIGYVCWDKLGEVRLRRESACAGARAHRCGKGTSDAGRV